MNNILITGISGFVGTNLSVYFKERDNIRIFGHSRKENTTAHQLPDLSANALDNFKIDVVIHLAGIAHDLGGRYQPEDYYQVNYEGTKKWVDEVLKSRVTKFIFVSSIKAACDTSATPADESIVTTPITHYGKSKRMAEQYIQSKSWGEKSYYILRPSMMHGPGNKGNLNLLYRFARSGMPFPFGAFHNQRSFHSIDNFCFVVASLIEKKINSGIYHLADDGFLSTVELYQLIAKTIGRKPKVWAVPSGLVKGLATITGKKSMLSKLTEDMMVSNTKIKEVIGVGSFPVTLKEGLEKTIRSFDGN